MLAEPENLGAYVRQKLRDAAQTASRLDCMKRLQARRWGTSSQQDERAQVDYQGMSGGANE
jgi:hypothetical protein